MKKDEIPEHPQIVVRFGWMKFWVDKAKAKKMKVTPGQELTKEQVDELMKPK